MRKDQNYIKLHNTRMLLKMIEDQRPISRADMVKLAKMSPTSVTRAVSALMELGLVRETDLFSTGLGRRAVMLDIIPSGAYTAGIHIDNAVTRLCLLDFSGTCAALKEIPMTDELFQPEALAGVLFGEYTAMLSREAVDPCKVIGLGVAIPGIVSHTTGFVSLSPQMHWYGVDISTLFSSAFGLPVLVENDVKATVVGQRRLYELASSSTLALLTVGSGVGAAVACGDTLVRGDQNAAGEIGHVVITPRGSPCECGRQGCLQTHMAEGYLLQNARLNDDSIRTLRDLHQAVRDHRLWADELLRDFLDHLYLAIDLLTNLYNPSAIIISGKVTAEFLDSVQLTVKRFSQTAFPPLAPFTKIIVDDNTGHGCVTGCAILAMQSFLYRLLEQIKDSEPI